MLEFDRIHKCLIGSVTIFQFALVPGESYRRQQTSPTDIQIFNVFEGNAKYGILHPWMSCQFVLLEFRSLEWNFSWASAGEERRLFWMLSDDDESAISMPVVGRRGLVNDLHTHNHMYHTTPHHTTPHHTHNHMYHTTPHHTTPYSVLLKHLTIR